MTAGKPRNIKNTAGRGKKRGGSPQFAAWLENAARDAGYDVDGRGWRRRLAEDTGLAESTVGRYLLATATPDPEACEQLAQALGLKPGEVRVAAGYPEGQVGATGVRYDSPAIRRANNVVARLRASSNKADHAQAARIEEMVSKLIEIAEAQIADGTNG